MTTPRPTLLLPTTREHKKLSTWMSSDIIVMYWKDKDKTYSDLYSIGNYDKKRIKQIFKNLCTGLITKMEQLGKFETKGGKK